MGAVAATLALLLAGIATGKACLILYGVVTRQHEAWSGLKRQQKEQHAASMAEKLEALRRGESVVLGGKQLEWGVDDEGSFWIDVPLDGQAEARRQIRAIEEHLDGLGRASKLFAPKTTICSATICSDARGIIHPVLATHHRRPVTGEIISDRSGRMVVI